ncbi:SdrD B-like domain-containing protein [Rubripirellula amarantea]
MVRRRVRAPEALEARRLMAADPIHVGVVYLETDYLETDQDVGGDSRGDRFILSFTGGAPDTELSEIRIRTDKDGDGISVGDPIFDTEPGGRGKDGSHDFQIVRVITADGRSVDATAQVEDGGQELVLRLSNFKAGDRLEFTLDVDEVLRNAIDLDVFNDRLDVITSGQEFQDSILEATFNAPHYETANADAIFLNEYGNPGATTGLNLPPDESPDVDSRPNRSAGAIASTSQTPKPIDISGQVWVDNNLDKIRQANEKPLSSIEIALYKQDANGQFVDTGHRATTDAQGRYVFAKSLGLLPGSYQVVETQPSGYYSVAAVPGTVAGQPTGNAASADVLTNINIELGDTSAINYDFAEAQPASVSGFVYVDADNDGVRDAGEQGIAGVRVQLVPINTIAPGSSLTVTTAADGSYTFTGLAPGSYEVIEVDQPSYLNDGLDSAGTVGGRSVGTAHNPGDRISGIVLAGADAGVEYNFGETPFGSIAGFVYLAAPGQDCDGEHSAPGTKPLPGVQVALQDEFGNTIVRTTTGADGGYLFDNVPVGNYRIVEFTPDGLLDGGSHAGTIGGLQVGQSVDGGLISGISMTPNGVGVEYNFCEAAPAVISGYVYHDKSDDGVRGSSEEGIPGTQIALVDASGKTVATTVTDSTGRYEFKNVLPGEYRLVETQPTGFYDGIDTPGTIDSRVVGQAIDEDTITAIVLAQGVTGINYNFGELRPASLSGRVHVDVDGDCILDDDEEVLAGVTIRLLDSTGKVVATKVTDTNGRYTFENIKPGVYTVVEEQPEGLFEGDAMPGSAGGTVENGSRIGTITLSSGETAVEYDFCERPPAQLSGNVFADRDQDCVFDADEPGLAGVLVELFDDSGNLVGSTRTDASGNYNFTGLRAGNYTVRETQPSGYLQGSQMAGSHGGDDSVDDVISRIRVGWGERLTQYNFCELEPSSISGFVYVDGNGDCVKDPDEMPLAGVVIQLRDSSGKVIDTTTTDAEGRYTFGSLTPGEYQVFELQPDGYFQGGQTPGTGEGRVLGEDLLGVKLAANQDVVDYSFCELGPSSISGFVYVDSDGDCERDENEMPLAGVVIQLRDNDGIVIETTTTDALGNYQFDNLPPGTYQIFELQPDGYFQGGQKPGTGDGRVLGRDLLGVNLSANQDLINYSFCELAPSSIGGLVYVDSDGDCERDEDEPPLAGVVIQLRDVDGKVIDTTTTDATGNYRFDHLAPGTYQIFEQQPDGFFQGGQQVGTGDGFMLGQDLLGVNLTAGQDLINYDFCELPPASISGRVWHESSPNRVFNAGDVPISGVLIELIGEDGTTIKQTRTDNAGNYYFDSLAPGVYSVREYQPQGLFHGGEVVGDAGGQIGGDDLLVGITLLGGVHATEYNFPEVPPAMISGYVFQDGSEIISEGAIAPEDLRDYRDGQLTSDDTRLSGVTLELRNILGQPLDSSRALTGTYGDGPIRVVTDENGYYEFAGLRPGTYHVYQVQPDDYADGLDTAGSTGGVAVNPADQLGESDQLVIQTLAASEATDPKDDAILNITLAGGGISQSNNFSEIIIRQPPPFQPPLPQVEKIEIPKVLAPIEQFDPRIRLVAFGEPLPGRVSIYGDDEWAVSWHLSVINGGENGESQEQRGTLGTDGVIRSASFREMNEAGNSTDHKRGRWTVADRTGKISKVGEGFDLGEEDAIALTGDFDGDGFDEAAIFVGGQWFVDLNGNGQWDAGDLWIGLGTALDRPVVGDWDGDGKDDVGIFGRRWQRDAQRIKRDPGLPDPENKRRRQVDSRKAAHRGEDRGEDRKRLMVRGDDGTLQADAVDHVFQYGEQVDTPMAGDWNGDGIDQIAVFRDGNWMLDVDGDGRWTDADEKIKFGRPGDEPIVGDFNNDLVDEIGVVRGDIWIIDTDGDRKLTGNDLQIRVPRNSPDSQPIVGDFDGDGYDEPGYYDEAS